MRFALLILLASFAGCVSERQYQTLERRVDQLELRLSQHIGRIYGQ